MTVPQEFPIVLVYIDVNVAKNLLRMPNLPRDESLSIAYLAAFLRPFGYPVKLLQFFDTDDCLESILNYHPKVVGFQTYPANWKKIRELCQRIKKVNSNIFILLGGYLATFNAEKLMNQEPKVDAIVCGEGEETLADLVNTLRICGDLSQVHGIVTRKDGCLIRTRHRRAIQNLDYLPFPARDILNEEVAEGKHFLSPTISTSRGCIMSCSFCSAGAMESVHQEPLRWRGRSPSNVVDEIELLLHQFPQVHNIHFFDRSFEDPDCLKKTRLRAIVDEILNRKVKSSFSCLMRTESWRKQDFELLLRMKRAGFDCVYLGFETGSEHGLKVYHKNATVADNRRAYELFKSAGMAIRFGFIMFNPYSTLEDLRLNLDFLSWMRVDHNFYVMTSDLEIYSETPILSQVKMDRLLIDDDPPDGAYKYHFLNPAVNQIYMVLNKLGHREMIRNYQDVLIRTEEGLPRWRNHSVIPHGELLEVEIVAFEYAFKQICQQTGSRIRKLFLELLSLASTNLDDRQAEDVAERIEKVYGQAYDSLRTELIRLHLNARRKGLQLIW